LPDISALNGTAIDNVAEFDGLTVTDVPAIAAPAAAYSVRLLDTAVGVPTYTGSAMRVREDSGDTETDIGFDTNGDLRTADIATHCGTASGFVVKWYDQSGNGNDVEQPTAGGAALQPQIYDGTTQAVITENGKPIISRVSNSSGFEATAVDMSGSTISVSSVSLATTSASIMVWFGTSLTERLYTGLSGSTVNDGGQAGFGTPSAELFFDGSSQGTQVSRGEAYTQFFNNQTLATWVGLTNLAGTQFNLSQNVGYWQMHNMQEIIFWESDQSSNRPDIEVDINNHFAIGNLPNPTSGLLFDYPDAAAAYSVRQLANTAALSMRVRRDTAGGTGDDDEADVLFDFTLTDPTISLDSRINNPSAGVASTTLGEFLNATGYTDVDNLTVVADGFCDTWYDQSGAGNDAEQDVPGSQPKIFDSASPTDLITRNGKPLIESTENVTSFNVVSLSQSAPYTMMGVSYNHNDFNRAIAFGNTANMRAIAAQNKAQFQSTSGSVITASVNLGDSSVVYTAVANGTNSFVRALGETASAETSGATTDTALTELQPGASGTGVSSMQELILWDGALSSTDYGAIETDMDTFFSVT
jgi:hypothetical protein